MYCLWSKGPSSQSSLLWQRSHWLLFISLAPWTHAALVCLPCLAFILHLGWEMQYFSAQAGSLVTSFQILRFFLINPSSINWCLHTIYIFFSSARRLRSELLLLLVVFPFWEMVQSCSCKLSLSSHTPLPPRPMTEGANSFVPKTLEAVFCIWNMFTAPSLVSLSNDKKKDLGELSAREGRRQEVLVLSIFEHLWYMLWPGDTGSVPRLCTVGHMAPF